MENGSGRGLFPSPRRRVAVPHDPGSSSSNPEWNPGCLRRSLSGCAAPARGGTPQRPLTARRTPPSAAARLMDGVRAPGRDWRLAHPCGMARMDHGSLHAATGAALLWCPEGRDWIGGARSRWGHCSPPSQALVRLTRTHGTNRRRAGGVHACCSICASVRARDMDNNNRWLLPWGSFSLLAFFSSCMTGSAGCTAANDPADLVRLLLLLFLPPSISKTSHRPIHSNAGLGGLPWMRSSTAIVASATRHRTRAFSDHWTQGFGTRPR